MNHGLGRLIEAEGGLIDALDRDDIDMLETAMTGVATALDHVRAAGGWRETPGVVAELRHALKLAESARIRINYLADRNHRRLDLLVGAAGVERGTPAYNKAGQRRG